MKSCPEYDTKIRLVASLFVCLFVFYSISTFIVFFNANPFLYKLTVIFQTIQFITSTKFNNQKTFLFQAIQFSQTAQFQTIQFSV